MVEVTERDRELAREYGLTGPEFGFAVQAIATARAEGRRQGAEASPDDLRALGWAVAVHNDYQQNGEAHTFWLFTRDGRAIKGEGRTDAEALNEVRRALPLPEAP